MSGRFLAAIFVSSARRRSERGLVVGIAIAAGRGGGGAVDRGRKSLSIWVGPPGKTSRTRSDKSTAWESEREGCGAMDWVYSSTLFAVTRPTVVIPKRKGFPAVRPLHIQWAPRAFLACRFLKRRNPITCGANLTSLGYRRLRRWSERVYRDG